MYIDTCIECCEQFESDGTLQMCPSCYMKDEDTTSETQLEILDTLGEAFEESRREENEYNCAVALSGKELYENAIARIEWQLN